MGPLWSDKPFLIEWFERNKDRKSYKSAVDDWGDKTAERRKKEGEQAFEKINVVQYFLVHEIYRYKRY